MQHRAVASHNRLGHALLRCDVLACLALLLIASHSHAQTQALPPNDDAPAKSAPFSDIRFDQTGATILISNQWVRWLEIDGITFDALRAESKRRHGGLWQKRIAEDLVELLGDMNASPAAHVMLTIRSLDEHAEDDAASSRQIAAKMTTANRQAVYRAIRERRQRETLLELIDAAAALNELTDVIAEHHAYATLRVEDVRARATQMIAEFDGPLIARRDVLLAALELVASLGDGHAGIDGWQQAAPDGYLPCLLDEATGGVVAFASDRSGLIDAEHPYLSAIDDVDLKQWLGAAARFATNGSPQLQRVESLELLRWITLIRDELGIEHCDTVELTLRDATGASKRIVTLPLAAQRPLYGTWPRSRSRILPESKLGYLRIASMSLNTQELGALRAELHSLLGQPGLIIDVRGNGGGDRHAMRMLLPYFMHDTDTRVVNSARLRLTAAQPQQPPDDTYLANRLLFPESSQRWTEAERRAITLFAASFEPQWQPTDDFDGYSVWHYDVISVQRFAPQRRPFAGPVVILMDEGCYSATDIFLGAFKGLRNVTLMGLPSGGGSARSKSYHLPTLDATVVLASMASYQPTGALYDTHGIEPDLVVQRAYTDLIATTDSQLDAAVGLLLTQLDNPH